MTRRPTIGGPVPGATLEEHWARKVPCWCDCGQEIEAMGGEVDLPAIGKSLSFGASLERHEGTKRLWIAIPTGPWSDADPRDVIVSLCTTWTPDGAWCRVVDGAESPWSRSKLFAGEDVRWIGRAEVLAQPGADRTFFMAHDAITASRRIAEFFVNG